MPALAPLTAAPASHRNPDSPADQALAKIVGLLVPAGYGFTIPAWDGGDTTRPTATTNPRRPGGSGR